ncbi:hypothetical protein GTO27_07095 [Candidatus Bathyarchaeota archaeon]|nr:hypothetical protein [Candidatus Bathyarchaeota archaeon]
MTSLESLLRKIESALKQEQEIRETSQEDMRKVTSLSKKAILLVHQKRRKKAEKLIQEANEILSRLNEAAEEYPEVIYSGLFDAARQEFSEANIFLRSTKESKFIPPEEINIPPVHYILGLADVIGEYRRLALDALREGSPEKGEEYLHTMDQIYTELMAMDQTYILVRGLRRKCDIARRIIETTRGDVTQEVRRSSLEKRLTEFEKTLQKSK